MHGLPLSGGGQVPLCLLRFQAKDFDPSWFASHALPCPPSIAASVRKRQAEYFHGRLAARQALARYGLAHIEVTTGAQREPCWPTGIIGSISHNNDYAAAVALRNSEHGAIGIDIETVLDASGAAAVARIALDAGELEWLRRQAGPASMELLLTMVFSAKESFYKAAFPAVGHIFDFSAVRISALDLAEGALELELCVTLCATLPAGMRRRVLVRMLDARTVCTSCDWARV
ncbi:MAG: 4'-phosphopantetheinyl transferase superfamily protein [Duganella sp.]